MAKAIFESRLIWLKQSYSDFEPAIFDDGSQDESGEILSSYSDPRLQVFSNARNQGLFKTLNQAIKDSEHP